MKTKYKCPECSKEIIMIEEEKLTFKGYLLTLLVLLAFMGFVVLMFKFIFYYY